VIFRTHACQLFAEGKSLKSEGIGMPRDKNKGLHGHTEPIQVVIGEIIFFPRGDIFPGGIFIQWDFYLGDFLSLKG
jgi:hypothetical protein